MNEDNNRMGIIHHLLRAYLKASDHPSKLRIYDRLRLLPGIRHATVRTPWGTVNLDLADFLQHEIFANTCYEPATFRLFNDLVQPGAKVIDVGANVGQYALSAGRRVGSTGKIIAIEPNPLICQKLLDNRRLNALQDRVDIVSAAVGSGDRLLDFGVPPPTNQGATRPRRDRAQESFWTSTISLARLVADFDFSDVHIVKVDVEGADIDVIRSLIERSNVRPKHLIFEYIPGPFDYGISSDDLVRYFHDYGYDLKLVTGDRYSEGCEIPESNLWAERRGAAERRATEALPHGSARGGGG